MSILEGRCPLYPPSLWSWFWIPTNPQTNLQNGTCDQSYFVARGTPILSQGRFVALRVACDFKWEQVQVLSRLGHIRRPRGPEIFLYYQTSCLSVEVSISTDRAIFCELIKLSQAFGALCKDTHDSQEFSGYTMSGLQPQSPLRSVSFLIQSSFLYVDMSVYLVSDLFLA